MKLPDEAVCSHLELLTTKVSLPYVLYDVAVFQLLLIVMTRV